MLLEVSDDDNQAIACLDDTSRWETVGDKFQVELSGGNFVTFSLELGKYTGSGYINVTAERSGRDYHRQAEHRYLPVNWTLDPVQIVSIRARHVESETIFWGLVDGEITGDAATTLLLEIVSHVLRHDDKARQRLIDYASLTLNDHSE